MFGMKGRMVAPLTETIAHAVGTFGRLAVEFEHLTADELVGRSPILGEVHLSRAAIREIRFPPPSKPDDGFHLIID